MSGHRRHLGRLRCLTLVAAIGVVVVAAAPARADPARARAHFELGRRYFQVDEYRKAMEEFKAAHIEEPDPAFLYNIAECHRRLGENKEAVVLYRRFLGLIPPNAPARANVEKRIAELQAASESPASSPAGAGAAAAAGQPSPAPPAPNSATVRAPWATNPVPPATSVSAPPLTVAASPEESPRAAAETSRPFYKSVWFYAILGGVLVGGAAGAWAISSGRDTPVPRTDLGNQRVFR